MGFRLFFTGYGRIFAAKHHALIGTVRVLEDAPHFHLDFMDERLTVANLSFNVAGFAE